MNEYMIQNLPLDEHLAMQMRTIISHALPMAPLTEPQETLKAFKMMIGAYECCTLVATKDEVPIAFIMLMNGPRPELARVMGVVSPEYQGRGIGYELWKACLTNIKQYPNISQLQSSTFASLTSGQLFLERAQFKLIERMIWLEYNLATELSETMQQKLNGPELDSVQVIELQDFTALRNDWDEACWQLETEASKDIPSQLGTLQPSLEEWRSNMEIFSNEKTILAIANKEPIGVIKVSELRDDYVNINFTAVASAYRRKGVSLLLKVTAFQYAKGLGASRITTQNHSVNKAILSANLSFGFKETDQILDYLYELKKT